MKVQTTTSVISKRGFTLLELLVVILIMTMAGTLLSISLSSIRWVNPGTQSRRIKAMTRYLSEKAMLTNEVYSLTVDLDAGRYWGEVQHSTDPCHKYLIASEEEKRNADQTHYNEIERGKIKDKRTNDRGSDFAHSRDTLLKETKLPEGLKFEGVLCEHFDGIVENGQVKIHFFPNGYVEHAFIYLAKGEDVYTIETIPLRGTAEVFKERLEEGDFEQPR